MAKIRHIAIKVEDQEKAADFYKNTFGMTEAWRGPVREDGQRAIYLTDGYINMAVLPARGGREGIDHFGFQVENMEETLKTAQVSGAQSGADKKPRHFILKITKVPERVVLNYVHCSSSSIRMKVDWL